MNKRDRVLLDKQLRGYTPRRRDGVMILTVVAVFFAGMTVGGVIFQRQSDPTRNVSGEETAISYLQGHGSP
jgi:hypothetical protein